MKEPGLSRRRRAFAEAYLASGDAVQSALAAGYSASTARSNAKRLAQQPDVAAYLAARRQQALEVDKGEVMRQLAAIAFADVHDFVRVENGALVVRSSAEVPAWQRGALASLRSGAKGIEVKLYDKLKALELLGKAAGLFEGKQGEEESGKFEVEIKIVE